MTNLLKTAASLLVISLALVGCATASPEPAGESPTESSEQSPVEPSAAPATGESFSGDGYSFVAPEGWGVPEGLSATAADTFAADLADADGFADNVNVVPAPGGEITPEQVESAGIDELEGAGATDVSFGDRLTVAGSETAHLSAAFSSNGQEYLIDQYYLTRDGQTFIVTFSFSPTVAAPDRDEVAQSLLATWQWA